MPEATGAHRTGPEVLAAAGLQGAVAAVVQAAVDRGAAVGTRQLNQVSGTAGETNAP